MSIQNNLKKHIKFNSSITENKIIMFGILIQTVFFIAYLIIGDVHVDETMTILNARSLCDSNTDILGEKTPIYFDTWIYGGQSPFATYLIAVFIKIFGYSIAVTRLPIFLFGIISLFALKSFLYEIKLSSKCRCIIIALFAISPWHLFQSTWTLDCAFLPSLLLIALCFLSKAVNREKKILFLTLSMIFFSLCFYSYIACVLLVPFLLIFIFIQLLIKKKIELWHAGYCAFVLFIVSLPFILFGLVQTDLLDNLTFLGISISKMEGYKRESSTLFGSSNPVKQAFTNIGLSALSNIIPDMQIFRIISGTGSAESLSVFSYAHILGGILSFSGMLYFFKTKKKEKSDNQYIFISSALFTYVIYSILVNYTENSAYKYSSFYFLFIIFEGTFINYLIKSKKSPVFCMKSLSVLMIISLILTSVSFGIYFQNTKSLYGKNLAMLIQLNEEKGIKTLCFANSRKAIHERQAVFFRFYDYDEIDSFFPLKDELDGLCDNKARERLLSTAHNIKTDGSWKYIPIHDGDILTEDSYLFPDYIFNHLKHTNTSGYTIEKAGCYVLLTKK